MSSKPSTDPAPGEDVFSEADLEPSDDDRRRLRLMRMDKAAVVVAVSAVGMWVGGMVALGACAAPMVFALTPYPFNGRAMGAAFQRFDMIAIGCAVIALGAEVVRTVLHMKLGIRAGMLLSRIRRYAVIVMAAGAVYTGMRISPAIMELHQRGVRRNVGADGETLQQLHAQAEFIGKGLVVLALVVIALHIATLSSAPTEDEYDEPPPLPPGPMGRRSR